MYQNRSLYECIVFGYKRSMRNNIDKLRNKAGWTVLELSKKLEISLGYLNKLKAGKAPINTILLQKMGDVFECDPANVLRDELDEELLKKVMTVYWRNTGAIEKKWSHEKNAGLIAYLYKAVSMVADNDDVDLKIEELTKNMKQMLSHINTNQ